MVSIIKIVLTVVVFVISVNDSYATAYAKRDSNEGKKYISIVGGYVSGFESDIDFPPVPNVAYSFDFDSTYTIGGAFGYYPSDRLRFEGELTYRKSKVDNLSINGTPTAWDEEITLWNWMANTFYEIPVSQYFEPYIGGGVGISHNSEQGEAAFAYQGMVGINFDMDFVSSISTGYRYFGTTNFDSQRVGGLAEFSVGQHIYELSYRLKF